MKQRRVTAFFELPVLPAIVPVSAGGAQFVFG